MLDTINVTYTSDSLFFVCMILLVNHFRFRRLIIPITLSPVFPRHMLKLAVPPPLKGLITLGLRAPTAPTYQQPEGQAAAWPWLRPWDLLPESARVPQQNRHCWSFPRLWCRAAPKMFCTSFQWHVQSGLCTAAVLYKIAHFGWSSCSSCWFKLEYKWYKNSLIIDPLGYCGLVGCRLLYQLHHNM